jgi:hypothetical protein
MKKKILITCVAVFVALIIGIGIGFFKTTNDKVLEIKDPQTISYFADDTMKESFSLTLPKDFLSKVFITIDTQEKGLQSYIFKHADSGEILFMIHISKGEQYKNLPYECELIKETKNYTYLWSQSVKNNDHIKDEKVKKEFSELAEYYFTIKQTITIDEANNSGSVVSVTDTTKVK